MQFRLRTLMILVAVSALLLFGLIKTGWFERDYKIANGKIYEKLEQPSSAEIKSWNVDSLIAYVRREHGINISAPNIDTTQPLDDLSVSSIRLKNTIRLALHSLDLTFCVRYGRLEIIHRDQADSKIVYSKGDLVRPSKAR